MKKLSMAAVGLAILGCSVASAQKMNASGATFPQGIYQRWFQEYSAAHKGVEFNYNPNGSGGGIKDLTDGTVDFAASDRPMTDAEIAAVKSKPLHFPTVLGAVVITYNLPGVSSEIKLTPETAAGLFMGSIKKWNDKKLAADNPGVKFPDEEIIPIHRSDSSGTTFVFTDYLSKVSPDFKAKVGTNTKVSWPVEGLNGQGNAGVANYVRQTPNSIGYVELTYAAQNKMAFATMKNAAGSWIKPSIESVTIAAAAFAKDMPADFRTAITNPPASAKAAYPIATFTYLLIPTVMADPAKASQLKTLLTWILGDAQKEAAGLEYAPLPKDVVAKEVKQLAMLKGAPAPAAKKGGK